MLASSIPIDLVFVLTVNEYHAQHVIECANAKKHVMIEKPMAQTLAECDAIAAAMKRNGVVIFVGYMRRYAGAMEPMKKALEGKKIKYARVRDIIGRVSRSVAPSFYFYRISLSLLRSLFLPLCARPRYDTALPI
jgi:predicted dehydrogenase